MKSKKELAEDKKIKRLYNRIKNILKGSKPIFLTLTFDNEILNHTNKETRQRYIKAFLNAQTIEYIANIDYGKKGKREHYHAIILTKNEKIDFRTYKYGKIKADYIGAKYTITTDKGLNKTADILTKHTIKDTTNREKIIYSRPNRQINT